jgi:hypothetical protein
MSNMYPEVLPAGTVTLEGSLAADELTLSETTTPPLGAGELRVTVPWKDAPPVTLVGLKASALNASGGLTVSVADFVTREYGSLYYSPKFPPWRESGFLNAVWRLKPV